MEPRSLLEKVDFHTHSEYSGEDQCQGFTIPRMFELADEIGLRYVSLTEHWGPTTDPAIFHQARREIDELNRVHQVKFFLSAEIAVLDSEGRLAVEATEAKKVLDFVSVGPHPLNSDPDEVKRMVLSLTENPEITVILHPHVLGVGNTWIDLQEPDEFHREIVGAIKAAGKIIECPEIEMLASHAESRGQSKEKIASHYRAFLKQVASQSALFTLGSDAHNERMWWYDNRPWFGNVAETAKLLRQYGVKEENLWIPEW